jgi:hypothetical protein
LIWSFQMRIALITLGLGALLAGCAGPKFDVASVGPGPDMKDAHGYRFAVAADPDSASDKLIQPLVQARLAAKGLARAGDDARYLLEVSYSERPLTVGAFAGAAPADPKQAPDWLAKPGQHRWRAFKSEQFCALGLRFVDLHTGGEAYRVRIVQQSTQPDCTLAAPRLADLALAEVPLSLAAQTNGAKGG